MADLETNLIKIIALAGELQDNYHISFEDYQRSLNEIIRLAKECLEDCKGV